MDKPYDTDLAYIHDTGYGDFARRAAPGLLEILAQLKGDSRRIVDLGCGSGIWARILTDAGYQVIGVDVSSAMIEIARTRVPQATFHVGSFVDLPIPNCLAVTALGEVFNYLFDPKNSLQILRKVFQAVFESLVPGGVLLFDVAEPGRCSGLIQRFQEGPDWTCLVEYQHDEPNRRLSRRIVTFRKIADAYRRHEETHHQQLYDRTEMTKLLNGAGLQVDVVTSYGESTFPHGVVGFVARKA